MKYYSVTEKELKALIAVVDSITALGSDEESGLYQEAKTGIKAIDQIGKRNGVKFIRDYSNQNLKI